MKLVKISKIAVKAQIHSRPENYLSDVESSCMRQDNDYYFMEEDQYIILSVKYQTPDLPLRKKLKVRLYQTSATILSPLQLFRSKTDSGLGDTVETVIHTIIGTHLAKKIYKRRCGCGKRKSILNILKPYKKRA